MAGSYNHCVYSDGTLRDFEDMAASLENGGDVWEAVEEMYGMIWYLAGHRALEFYGPLDWRSHVSEIVEQARQNYKSGVERYAPGDQKAFIP